MRLIWREAAEIADSEQTWVTVKKLALHLLNRGELDQAVAPGWQLLLAKLDSKKRFGLSRFAHFCTAQSIAPDAADDEALARFHAYLNQTLMNKSPRDIHRTACKVWNKAADSIEGWPQQRVKVPRYRRDYALPLDGSQASSRPVDR